MVQKYPGGSQISCCQVRDKWEWFQNILGFLGTGSDISWFRNILRHRNPISTATASSLFSLTLGHIPTHDVVFHYRLLWHSSFTSSSTPVEQLLCVGCLTSQQHASVSRRRICSDSCTWCHTETEVVDQTFYLTQSQYTNIQPISHNADPITPGAWQSSTGLPVPKSLV